MKTSNSTNGGQSNGAVTGHYFESIKQLREILGDDVLLLPWPKGSKGTKRKWGHRTVASMTPDYLAKLERGNIGVALGEKSGNLVALDLDDQALIEPFLRLNPWLKNTLQTCGRPERRVFWLRMMGNYPAKMVKLKTLSGGDVGEWRAGKNSQSIIRGIHPDTGNLYQVLNMDKPLVVDFASIAWPDEISNPPIFKSELLVNVTERQRDGVTELQSNGETDVTDETDAIVCASVPVSKALSSPFVGASASGSPSAPIDKTSLDFSKLTIADAVALSLPDRVHQNNDCLFSLGRAVKRLESNSGKQFTTEQLLDVFSGWHSQAAPFLRGEQSRDDYKIQFMNAYKSAKIPLGEDGVNTAWIRVQQNPLPSEATKHFEDTNKRLLVALCRELQIIHVEQPFFLSARTAQKLFKLECHTEAARWLRSFCVLKILDEVEKGKGARASRYRFNFVDK